MASKKRAQSKPSQARKKKRLAQPQTEEHAKPIDKAKHEGGIEGLVAAWNSSRDPFNAYVERVSQAYQESHLALENAGVMCKANAMEIWAVLRFASMDEEALALFAGPAPPKTTWLLFADATLPAIKVGIAALEKLRPGESPSQVVADVIKNTEGPSEHERVAGLPAAVLWHMATKAEKYRLFREKDHNFLRSMGRGRKYGQKMTAAQTAYLHSLLGQMVDAGAVKRKSPDGDEDACLQVLAALGR